MTSVKFPPGTLVTGGANIRHARAGRRFGWEADRDAAPTIVAGAPLYFLPPGGAWEPLEDTLHARIQSFPEEYNFMSTKANYVCGMSVPPLMMQRVATEVAKMLGVNELPAPVTGPWLLKDLREGRLGSPRHGLKVLSTFACGGGSTMGYKLAGFDVVGAVEIDSKMAELYRRNLNPRYMFVEDIRAFKVRDELPEEFFSLDVLDGSPPCSSFSMAGAREKDWGKKKQFREGQAHQVLDDLFFHFIDIAGRLRPKMVVAENVKGLVLGNARGYVKEIFQKFREAGYDTQLFLLNASRMGVPQRRERTFFIARRMDIGLPPLKLEFHEPEISVRAALEGASPEGAMRLPPSSVKAFRMRMEGLELESNYSTTVAFPDRPSPTMTSNATTAASGVCHWEGRKFSPAEALRVQGFPDDYAYGEPAAAGYVCGMSVPPPMMQRISTQMARLLRAG